MVKSCANMAPLRTFLILAATLGFAPVQVVMAGCNRSSLDNIKKNGNWDDIYNVKEFTWADYLVQLSVCGAAAALSGGAGTTVCASGIYGFIETSIFTYLTAGRYSPAQLIDAIKLGSIIGGDKYEGKVGLTIFQCTACNCKSCIKRGIPRIGDCKRCGEWCVPEPNHVSIYIVRRKKGNGSLQNIPAAGAVSSLTS